MKIRILDDSVRLRLERAEVDAIGRGEPVESATRFPGGGTFRYRLETGAAQTHATFDDGCICLAVPADAARQWAETETNVSLTGEGALPDGQLRLLIEKDFECLEPRDGESQSNRFRNPKAE